jgi:hypothetical protein
MAAGPRDTWERRSAEALKHTASNTNTDIDSLPARRELERDRDETRCCEMDADVCKLVDM